MSDRRDLRWRAGAPLRAFLIGGIRVYRATLAGMVGGQCRFYPSCSHYAEDAVRAHGALRGIALATWRIARCGPFTRGGVDYVPAQGKWADPFHRNRRVQPPAAWSARS